jgi:hypothetical protein
MRAGWRYGPGQSSDHRERNAQNSRRHIHRDRRRDRDLRSPSPGFVVVRFGIGDGLGRDGVVAEELGLEPWFRALKLARFREARSQSAAVLHKASINDRRRNLAD